MGYVPPRPGESDPWWFRLNAVAIAVWLVGGPIAVAGFVLFLASARLP